MAVGRFGILAEAKLRLSIPNFHLKKILVFVDWFTPGFRAGGPIKSITNFVQLLSHDFQLFVYTSDRDLGQQTGYENIPFNQWVRFNDNVQVYYTTPEMQNSETLKNNITVVNPDFIYLNSMFSKHFSIEVLLLKNNFKNCKFILAPRGMLKNTALSFKPYKKKLFLFYAKIKGLYRNVYFHATDPTEVTDIKKKIGTTHPVLEISNCPAKPVAQLTVIKKEPGFLKIIFIGRVHPIKNLYFFLQVLSKVKATVQLSIVGVLEDENYWNKCRMLINQFPESVTVDFLNELAPADLENCIESHHVLVLPTQGENFGHAIYETLALGRPVIISDQTPWRHLQDQQAGWDLPLHDSAGFEQAIECLAATNQTAFDNYCINAHRFAADFYNQLNSKQKYLQLFS
jgi:glycosyltransferase involved in cell wall biosynthesis